MEVFQPRRTDCGARAVAAREATGAGGRAGGRPHMSIDLAAEVSAGGALRKAERGVCSAKAETLVGVVHGSLALVS